MNKKKRFTCRFPAWIFVVCLVLSTLLTACSSNDTDSKDVVSNEVTDNSEVADNSEVVDTEEAPQPTEAPAVIEWPEEFSLYEAYEDAFLIGTIYTDANLSGKDKELTLNHFNIITPENLMKPQYMQPQEGTFSYSSSDTMLKFAQENNLFVHGHTLAWHNQSGNFLGINVTRDEAIEQLKNHIINVAGKYKGQITSWDVVNEAINDGTTLPADGDWTKCLRQTQWLKSIGSDYLALAFTFAHEADPDAVLYYNDYNLNNKNKADIVYAMVKDLQAQGVPIHGIGMQGHYGTDTSVGSVEYSLQHFAELGVEVSITELDLGVKGAVASGLTEEQEIIQGIAYAKLFQLFKEYKDTIARVTFWGYVDNRSWRAESFPCLFNADYSPKMAAYAVLDPDKYLSYYDKVIEPTKANVIDAEVDTVWENCPEALVNNQVVAWEGATGKARLLWDEAFVYVLIEVKDSVLNKQSPNVYEHDSVEIFLDQKNEKNAFYDENDGQYRVNYSGSTTFGTVPPTPGFASAAKEVDGGYLIELAIPLIEAGKEGMVMGFDAQINDANNGGIRQSIAKFNDITDNSWSATDKWGTVELVK